MKQQQAYIERCRPTCPYCGSAATLRGADEVFRAVPEEERGRFYWVCPKSGCDSRAGCHRRDKSGRLKGYEPMATMADHKLRLARREAHAAFDLLWETNLSPMSRTGAYSWLAHKMDLPKHETHIGLMDTAQCADVIRHCRELETLLCQSQKRFS